MASTDRVVIKEIRSGLYKIIWDFSKDVDENEVSFSEKFTLNVFKSTMNFIMHLNWTATTNRRRCKHNLIFLVEEVINGEAEFIDCSSNEDSPNEDEVFEEDAHQDDEDSITDEEEEEDANQGDEDGEEEHEAEEQMDSESSPNPLEIPKTENYSPLHLWIYTSEPSIGNEIQLSKENSNAWKVKWRSHNIPDLITAWIDFGTHGPSARNVMKSMSEIAGMFHDQLRCDVQFNFKDGKSVGAHILILSVGSPVFSAMFQSGFQETQTHQVTISDIEIEVFRQLLIHLYTGSAPKLADENITQLLFEAADKYSIETLKDDCVETLKGRIQIDNVVNLLVWSHFHSIQSLVEMALKFTVENYRKIFLQTDFEDFLKKFPDLCLRVMKCIASA